MRNLQYFYGIFKEQFKYCSLNCDLPEINYLTQDEENFARNFSRFINEANVIEMMELFERTRRDIGQNANARIEFFDLAMQVIVLLIRK